MLCLLRSCASVRGKQSQSRMRDLRGHLRRWLQGGFRIVFGSGTSTRKSISASGNTVLACCSNHIRLSPLCTLALLITPTFSSRPLLSFFICSCRQVQEDCNASQDVGSGYSMQELVREEFLIYGSWLHGYYSDEVCKLGVSFCIIICKVQVPMAYLSNFP